MPFQSMRAGLSGMQECCFRIWRQTCFDGLRIMSRRRSLVAGRKANQGGEAVMKETADKALEMVKEVGLEAAAILREASPEIWRAAKEKVVADAYVAFLVAAVLLIIAGVTGYGVRLIIRAAKDDDDLYGAVVFVSVIALAVGGAGVFHVATGVRMLVASDWYAIQMLLEAVRP